MRCCESGTCSDGLSTNVLPQTTAKGRNHSGTIAGKLNGAIAAHDADRLPHDRAVDAVRDVLEAVAHQHRRAAAGHLDALDAAPHAAARLVERLAVLGRDHAASSSKCSSSSALKRNIARARTTGGVSLQPGNACRRRGDRGVDVACRSTAARLRDDAAARRIVDVEHSRSRSTGLQRPPMKFCSRARRRRSASGAVRASERRIRHVAPRDADRLRYSEPSMGAPTSRSTFTGLRFENPFLLSSAPPTESDSNIMRAFDAGWGGVVTKTIGLHPGRQRRAARRRSSCARRPTRRTCRCRSGRARRCTRRGTGS